MVAMRAEEGVQMLAQQRAADHLPAAIAVRQHHQESARAVRAASIPVTADQNWMISSEIASSPSRSVVEASFERIETARALSIRARVVKAQWPAWKASCIRLRPPDKTRLLLITEVSLRLDTTHENFFPHHGSFRLRKALCDRREQLLIADRFTVRNMLAMVR